MNSFGRARIELTVRYTFLSGLMLALFTISAMMAESKAFDLIEEAIGDPVNRPVLTALLSRRLDMFESDFARRLLIFDGLLLAMSGLASYYLAGKTLTPIEQMMTEQKEFAAEASHELKTPLAVIQLEAEALLRQDLPDKAKKKIQVVTDEVGRMARLTERLTAWVRPKQQVVLEKVDLAELAPKVIEPLERYWQNQKGIMVKFASEKETCVMANVDELKQILVILIDNACKYSKDGGLVEVWVDIWGQMVRIKIQDSGEGISKEDIHRVFEKYYRGKTRQKGLGLGLPIAKKLLSNIKGKIKINSEIGRGSLVEVLIPLVS